MREQFFPKGWELCASEFLELFHRYGYIYRPLIGGNWVSAKENWRLSDTEILKAIAGAHDKFYIGTRAGNKTRYAVLDIDAKSKYHTKPQFDRLMKVLAQVGLGRSSLYRSSFNGGWHLYIFFDEDISSADLRRQLVRLLNLNDFEVAKGTLEVFPHPGDASLGMGLRVPLQHGWAWLDKKNLEVEHERFEMSATKALEFFIDVLQSDANSFKDFQKLKACVQDLETRRSAAARHGASDKPNNVIPLRKLEKPVPTSEYGVYTAAIFNGQPPGINPENWYKGRQFHLEGLSGPSQRADAIFCLGHYFFYGDPSRNLPALGYGYEEERDWAICEFLEARHNGHSKDINRGRADAISQVHRATNWRPSHKKGIEPKKYTPNQPLSWVRENANRLRNARKRISDALDGLKKLKRSFTTVELQEAAGCARDTLYKHDDIWRKDYEDLAEGFFAICPDEYNAVVEAASSESKPPSTVSSKITPPGLLAARRIIYEMSMRSKRDIQNKQNAVLRSSEAADKEWRDKVSALTKETPCGLPTPRLKSLLFVLANYLSVAPYEEDATALLPYVRQLRHELSVRSRGPDPAASG